MRARRGLLGGTALLLVLSFGALGSGIGLFLSGYALDLTTALEQAPQAAGSALAALGMPDAEAEDLLTELVEGLAGVPRMVPIPLLIGSVELGLPLGVVDGIRLRAGGLDDRLARRLAALAGIDLPAPLVEGAFGEGEFAGTYAADVAFSTLLVSAEAVKRLDLLFLGLSLALGLEFVRGGVAPLVAVDVPGHSAGAQAALAALHLDGLTWSALSVRGAVGLEVGPPFLRLCAEAGFALPLSGAGGWWGLVAGNLDLSVGMVIHF